MSAVRLDDETWEDIRRAYETTKESVHRIAARFGTSKSNIYTCAARQGWTLRSRSKRVIAAPSRPLPGFAERGAIGRAAALPLPEAPADAGPAPAADIGAADGVVTGDGAMPLLPTAPDTPEQRDLRLLRIIDLQLSKVEEHMLRDDLTPQDHERLARTTASLKAQSDELTDGKSNRGTASDGGCTELDHLEAERLRLEIAERIERLNAQWLAEKTAG